MQTYLLIFTSIQLLQGIFLWKGYQKAGYKPWVAFAPFYNTIIALRIVQRPWWWAFFLYIPLIGNMLCIVLIYEWLNAFGYRKKRYTFLSVITLGLFLAYLMYSPLTTYIGKDEEAIKKNVAPWINATLFAVIVASFIHTYFIQPFTIPTSSLEKSLLVGDFVFVSKFHYGIRMPMTPFSAPMVHDTIPIIKTKSYLKDFQLPYLRLPALQKVKRNDIVVFNWPADTVYQFRDPLKRPAVHKPIDKKSNYVKRVVAIAGDTLSIKNGIVYINNKESQLPKSAKLQHAYRIKLSPKYQLTNEFLYKQFNITDGIVDVQFGSENIYTIASISDDTAERLKKLDGIITVEKVVMPQGEYDPSIYPHNPHFKWNVDNFGPIILPKKGQIIKLTPDNIILYKTIISEYEKNSVKIINNQIFINEKPETNYTFTKDYYWMMGDNRHNSEDSRSWGVVPDDHILGKPILIWMSIDFNTFKIRWERLFSFVNTDSDLVSYRYHFLILALIIWGAYTLYKRKNKAND